MCTIIKVYEFTRNFNKCPVMFSLTFTICSSFFSSLLFCYLNMNIINIRKDWRRKWQPSPVFLPGKFHGQRSLAGYSPRDCKQSDTTEHMTLTIVTIKQIYNTIMQSHPKPKTLAHWHPELPGYSSKPKPSKVKTRDP